MKIATEMTADSRSVYERLGKAKIGDTVTYEELKALTRRDVQGDDRYILNTALKNALRDGKVFGCVRTVGVKLLNDGEIISDAESVAPRIRRISRRASRRLTAVQNFDKLSSDQKVKHNALLSVFGAITAMGRAKSIARVEQEVKRTSQSLSLSATLEVFADE